MHPSPAFAWMDEAAMLAFIGDRGFATICIGTAEGPRVAHAPMTVTPARKLQFHLARSNRATPFVAGQRVTVSVTSLDAYQSASWYVSENQVPTWHYQAVEVEGVVRELTSDELVAQIDALSDKFERLHSPERPWTRDKLDPRRFDALLRAIVGFEIDTDSIRGTRKFNQHKSAEDKAATIAGLEGVGRFDVAEQVRVMGSEA
jgi:transcriptional regulator